MKKKLFLIISILFSVQIIQAQADSRLAMEYFQNEEYDKAVFLFEKLYEDTQSKIYLSYYVKCLVKTKDFKTAEKVLKKQQRKAPDDLTYSAELGYVYEIQGDNEKANELYQNIIKELPANKIRIIQIANIFLNKQKYNLAEQTYLQGRKKMNENYTFHLELASVYGIQRKYQNMIDEYLDYVTINYSALDNVKDRLQYSISNDIDNVFTDLLRTNLLKRIQGGSGRQAKNIYSDLLIWLLVQEKKFDMALIQVKALDKRNNEQGFRILKFCELAISNQFFDVAIEGYQAILDDGKNNPYYLEARQGILNALYQKIALGFITTKQEITKLEENYLALIKEYGRRSSTVELMKDLAHLQAFYLDKPDEARQLMEDAIKLPGISAINLAECRLELADIMVMQNNVWKPTLIYAQIEEKNSENPIGHEAKFRRARLAYYIGNFAWAQAQLDILKESTSKLIANDAIDLSLLIRNNAIIDSAEAELKMYARADLLHLQNKDSLALLTLDSLIEKYATHDLVDQALYKKALIMSENRKFEEALTLFEKVANNYSYELLADDALFKMGDIYEKHLKDKEKAMEAYKNLMLNFQGSIYIIEARKRFRALREGI